MTETNLDVFHAQLLTPQDAPAMDQLCAACGTPGGPDTAALLQTNAVLGDYAGTDTLQAAMGMLPMFGQSRLALALRAAGDQRIVGDHDNRGALLVQLAEQVEHDLLVLLVEVAGRLVGEQWNDEDAKRAYEAAGGKPAFTGSAAEGAQNGGIAISFADPTKAAKTGDTDAANVAVAAGVADDTDVEPDVTKGEQA